MARGITTGIVRGPAENAYTRAEILHIRHHSLFAPRDFDISPYFAVVKPALEGGFDYRRLVWDEADSVARRGDQHPPDAAAAS